MPRTDIAPSYRVYETVVHVAGCQFVKVVLTYEGSCVFKQEIADLAGFGVVGVHPIMQIF